MWIGFSGGLPRAPQSPFGELERKNEVDHILITGLLHRSSVAIIFLQMIEVHPTQQMHASTTSFRFHSKSMLVSSQICLLDQWPRCQVCAAVCRGNCTRTARRPQARRTLRVASCESPQKESCRTKAVEAPTHPRTKHIVRKTILRRCMDQACPRTS